MRRRPRVALIVESSRNYGRGLLSGIVQYARIYGPWSFFCQDRGLGNALPKWLSRWNGDGIIVRAESPDMEARIGRRGIPAVNLRRQARLRLPLVASDEKAVAEMAFKHLLERGFRHFAYCGFAGLIYSEQRRHCFAAVVAQAGYPCQDYVPRGRGPNGSHWEREQHGLIYEQSLARWVDRLPKPVGIMACSDLRAQQLLNACQKCRAIVPEKVAVVGVDNDPLLCELSDPPLSSIDQDAPRVGYEAAALLDRLMQGQSPPPEPLLIPPRSIVSRRSTDTLAIEDPEVARAVHFVRQHACSGITMEDVVRHVSLTRVTLKRRFERLLGRSPKAEIMRLKLEKVKQLLAETDLNQAEIARLAGFRHPEYMSAAFHDKMGQTPGRYRTACTKNVSPSEVLKKIRPDPARAG